MRRSIPGKVSKSMPTRRSTPQKVAAPKHDPNYEMQYGCSRKTGKMAGGYFWNPPNYCEAPKIERNEEDTWVRVCFCKQCNRYKTRTCPARETTTNIYAEDYQQDTPKTRVRKTRRRS